MQDKTKTYPTTKLKEYKIKDRELRCWNLDLVGVNTRKEKVNLGVSYKGLLKLVLDHCKNPKRTFINQSNCLTVSMGYYTVPV